MRTARLATALVALAAPLGPGAAEGSGLASRAGWAAAIWMLASLAATVVVAIWFRARARANQRLSAEIRREDWLAARDGALRSREPAE